MRRSLLIEEDEYLQTHSTNSYSATSNRPKDFRKMKLKKGASKKKENTRNKDYFDNILITG